MAINYSGLGMFAPFTEQMLGLGRNVTRGVGTLFGIKDPEMEAQRILSTVDYENPAALRAAAQELFRAGKIDEATALVRQATAAKQRQEDIGFRERQMKVTESAEQRAAETQRFLKAEKDPYGELARINKLPDGPEKEAGLANINRIIGEQNLKQSLTQMQFLESEARFALAQAQAGEVGKGKLVTKFTGENGELLMEKGGQLYKASDGTRYTGKGTIPISDPVQAMLLNAMKRDAETNPTKTSTTPRSADDAAARLQGGGANQKDLQPTVPKYVRSGEGTSENTLWQENPEYKYGKGYENYGSEVVYKKAPPTPPPQFIGNYRDPLYNEKYKEYERQLRQYQQTGTY